MTPEGDYRVWLIAYTCPDGRRGMLDSDDRDGAHELAHRIEMKRGFRDVSVIGPQVLDVPDGLKERIWERIAAERGERNARLVLENREWRTRYDDLAAMFGPVGEVAG